jgi:hypothetical protein
VPLRERDLGERHASERIAAAPLLHGQRAAPPDRVHVLEWRMRQSAAQPTTMSSVHGTGELARMAARFGRKRSR